MDSYVFVLGAAIGFAAGYYCWKVKYDLLKVVHAREIKEWADEQKRLRTQVAGLVGDAPHGVKSITRGRMRASRLRQIARRA